VVVGAHRFRNHFGYYMERAAKGDECWSPGVAAGRQARAGRRRCR
jgi:hypothetical protein